MLKLLNGLRSILFNLVFYIFTVIYLMLIFCACLLPDDKLLRIGVLGYCLGCLWIARIFMGITHEFRGLDKLPTDEAFILACKHQSYMDPPLSYVARCDVTALAKKELFSVPVLGQILKKIGIVRIDRKSRSAHAAMPEVGRKVVEAKKPLIIYPEGTRVPVGEVRKLKMGAYHLHKDNGLPVYPVASNAGACWSKGFWHKPGHVVYEVQDRVAEGLDRKEFMDVIAHDVVERSDELMIEFGVDPSLLMRN